uniref:Uncharacterized protein n=1 Tax=Nothoprocta perdicaria TaxID=30464 RepID=A0A8C6Z366_NOTPE
PGQGPTGSFHTTTAQPKETTKTGSETHSLFRQECGHVLRACLLSSFACTRHTGRKRHLLEVSVWGCPQYLLLMTSPRSFGLYSKALLFIFFIFSF